MIEDEGIDNSDCASDDIVDSSEVDSLFKDKGQIGIHVDP